MAQPQLTPEERAERVFVDCPHEPGGCCVACIAAGIIAAVAEERGRWILALCPGCNAGHVLDNGRVWGFCGTRRSGMPEAEIAAAIRARTP